MQAKQVYFVILTIDGTHDRVSDCFIQGFESLMLILLCFSEIFSNHMLWESILVGGFGGGGGMCHIP